MSDLLLVPLCAVVGLVVGSFVNVVVERVPRKESILSPPSHCRGCGTPIAPRDNVPVVSWLLLRARCRTCGERISGRYPLVELATAALFVAAAFRFGDDVALPAYLVLFASLVAISAVDLERYIIPNRIVYPTVFLSLPLLLLAAAVDDRWKALEHALVGGAAAWTFLLVVHVVSPRGMGFGDVRLSFVLGLFLGWLSYRLVFYGMFLGFLLGAVIGLLLIAVRIRGRKEHIPFGPFLAAGTILAVLLVTP